MLFLSIYATMSVISMFQDKCERSYSILVVVFLNAIFFIVMTGNNSAWYFIAAAMTDLLAIILMLPVSDKDRLSKSLSTVCAVSILINVAGCIAWYNFREPTLYNNASIALMVWAIILMIITKDSDVESNRDNSLRPGVRVDRDSSSRVAVGDKEAL